MMKTIIHTMTIVLLLASSLMAGRIAPSDVPPVITEKAIFSVPHFSGKGREKNGGYIEAHHPETKKFLWRVQIYNTIYKKGLEGDVQDVFITSLSFDKSHNWLLMPDERGRVFVLDLETRNVTQIKKRAKAAVQNKSIGDKGSKEDRVLAMIQAVILDALNDRAYREKESYNKPFQLKNGYYFYYKHRLSELPQKESNGLRVFVINEVKVKFKDDTFVSEEIRFGYKLKYVEKTGEIFRWREVSGWKPIEDDPFFGKNPKLKNFKPKL